MIEYTVKVLDDGSKYWCLNGKQHREDGPAVESSTGTKFWYLNDQLHREDGPAIEYSNGSKEWYLNGKRHRKDGPACEWSDGSKVWCLNNEEMTQQEHKKATTQTSCEGKEVEIDGVTYVLKEKQND